METTAQEVLKEETESASANLHKSPEVSSPTFVVFHHLTAEVWREFVPFPRDFCCHSHHHLHKEGGGSRVFLDRTQSYNILNWEEPTRIIQVLKSMEMPQHQMSISSILVQSFIAITTVIFCVSIALLTHEESYSLSPCLINSIMASVLSLAFILLGEIGLSESKLLKSYKNNVDLHGDDISACYHHIHLSGVFHWKPT